MLVVLKNFTCLRSSMCDVLICLIDFTFQQLNFKNPYIEKFVCIVACNILSIYSLIGKDTSLRDRLYGDFQPGLKFQLGRPS